QEVKSVDERIVELSVTISNIDKSLKELLQKRRDLIKGMKDGQIKMVKAKERQLLEKAQSIAKERLLQGKKLTFHELKLILDEDFKGNGNSGNYGNSIS
ncbi:MAG: hypothetical protein N3F06_02105, partial [Nitrososphaerales archaeon]|nr:hypothetical protein [Nitrososphaerales archaeon]